MKQFSILHNFEHTQCLIDTTFNHEKDNFELSLKFWCVEINGYLTMGLEWPLVNELDFNRTFEDMKQPEKCLSWMEKLTNQVIG